MTTEQLMKLVTAYAEACDDLGTDLFNQTAAQTSEKHAAAKDIHDQIRIGVERLNAHYERAERRALTFADLLHENIIGMRAAVVAGKLETADIGLQWICNALAGPGLLPDLDQARALGSAQALWDKEMAEHEAFRAAHPAPAASGQVLWICGKHLGNTCDGPAWSLQGIFDSESAAIAACVEPHDFIGPVPLNQRLPQEAVEWPGVRFPIEAKS